MKTVEQVKMRNLPIARHFEESALTVNVQDSLSSFRKGELPIYNILKLAVIGVIGYFSWIYVLPPLFQAIGSVLATVGTIVLVVFFFLMAPVIFKALRRFTRVAHKAVIRHDPFGEIEEQRDKMIKNREKFQHTKQRITNMKSAMERDAFESQKNAENLQSKILSLNKKAVSLKSTLDSLEKQHGKKAVDKDEHVHANTELMRVVSEARRKSYELEQQKDFITKYGTRAQIMKKLGQKLTMAEAAMDIKILDTDATIEILKKDYELAIKMKQATTAAKDVLSFTEGWEFEYAVEVVSDAIARDTAATLSNLKDIEKYTDMYSLDQEELYENLNQIAESINTGRNVIPEAKVYSSESYIPTHEDRVKSGGFENFI